MWKNVVVNRKIDIFVAFGYMPKINSNLCCVFVYYNAVFTIITMPSKKVYKKTTLHSQTYESYQTRKKSKNGILCNLNCIYTI